MAKTFKSLHIDLENNIFELNGERMRCVSDLELCTEKRKGQPMTWALRITKDEIYTGQTWQHIKKTSPRKKFRYRIHNFFNSVLGSVFYK